MICPILSPGRARHHDGVNPFPIEKSYMSKTYIPLTHPDQIRTLFGPRDRYLKQLCDKFQVDVVVRGDQILVQGEPAQVEKGVKALQDMLNLQEKNGPLVEDQIDTILSTSSGLLNATDVENLTITFKMQSRPIAPKSPGQVTYMRAVKEKELVFCSGPAGSGKTFLAVAMALEALRKERVRKICLVRPAVEAGEKLGFLPGDLQEKVNPYLRPLLDAMREMIDLEQFQRYIRDEVIEILPLAFMRGRTLNNTFMILDEGQNTTITQMKMFLTRMGQGSRVIVTGDLTQNDLPNDVTSGLSDAIARLRSISGISIVQLEAGDIMRHPLVRAIVNAYDGDYSKVHNAHQRSGNAPVIQDSPQASQN